MLTDDMIDHEEQFERLKKLNTRLTAGDGPDMVEIREQFERCEKLWTSLQGGVDALSAAMEPWKKLTNQHDELEYWFSELEKRASRDLNELGEVHDETSDVCDHIYKLKVKPTNEIFLKFLILLDKFEFFAPSVVNIIVIIKILLLPFCLLYNLL